jgi:hypothetical protein
VYALGVSLSVHAPTGIALYLVTTPLGFVLLAWSLWHAFGRRAETHALAEAVDGA